MIAQHLTAFGIFFASAGLAAYLIWRGHTTRGSYNMWKDRWALTWPFPALLSVVSLIIFLICLFVPQYTEGACARWGEQVGRETQFIRTTYWEWHCNVRTDEGWIDRDSTIKVDD